MTVWEKIIVAVPVDRTAAVVTSQSGIAPPAESFGKPYEHLVEDVQEWEAVELEQWEPGAFSRKPVPHEWDRMTGRVSGYVTVLGKWTEPTRKGWTLVCKCTCGNYVLARKRHIRHQAVRMCAECKVANKNAGRPQPERKYGHHWAKKGDQ